MKNDQGLNADRWLAAAYCNELLGFRKERDKLQHWEYTKNQPGLIEYNVRKSKFPKRDALAEVLKCVRTILGCDPDDSHYGNDEQTHTWRLSETRSVVVKHRLRAGTYIQLIDTGE